MVAATLGATFAVRPAQAAPGDISGTVFNDVNNNGANDAEAGVAGVTVTAFDTSGGVAATATTAASGDYTIAGLTDGTPYRIEFTTLPTGWTEGPIGPDSESSITFASPETTGVDFGVHEPVLCDNVPPSSALLFTHNAAVTCSAVVDPALPKDAFALLDITNAVPAAGRSEVTGTTPVFHHPDWHIDQLGNLFGIAIDSQRGDLYTTASSNYSHEFYTNAAPGNVPAIVQYGNIGGGFDDIGAAGTIYQLDGVTGDPTVFAQLPQQLTAFNHVDCEADNVGPIRNSGVGLGNTVYDETNDQLFVSNWEDGYIYRLDMNGTILDAYDPDLTDDGTAGMAADRVPFGLEISADGSRLYWGTVFEQEVWSLDLTATGAFPGVASSVGSTIVFADDTSETLEHTIVIDNTGEPLPGFLNTDPHYYVSDLEITPAGEMMVGLRVGCNDSPHSAYNHRGQTHILSADGAGRFTNNSGPLDISVTETAGLDDNYGGVAYYERPDGSVDYAVTSADIINEAGPHGLAVFREANAGDSPISPLGAIDYGTPNDPKGIAGDVEVLNVSPCTPSPIEIGNYVWLDVDQDGVQDPDEPVLANVTVNLFASDGTTLLATTTTGPDGEYIFDDADGVVPNTSYVIGFDVSTNTTPLPGGAVNADLTETVADSGSGATADMHDSDVVNDMITVTTGGPGSNDHTLDAGYSLPYDLALIKVYSSDSFGDATDGIIEQGSDVTFTITVTNQGVVDATTFDVTDYIPTGFSLNDPAWTDNGDGTATITAGPLAAGDDLPITITLTADSVAPGEFVNWAEISADDGNDVDSTPNADQTDDNQPDGPGEATDDDIDNNPGPRGDDEDDHDPAGVTVAAYDLALTKVYTSDTHDNGTDGIIANGSSVTFTITVTNQGTVDATTFDVTDYIPTGFSLNDPAWTDNGDGTATITAGPLAAGDDLPITITLDADAAGAGESVNWAEISADDGNDSDSTPNADQTDDNQPDAPGDPTDDDIDNNPGPRGDDEDDHDPAGVTVESYDLALTKVYTSDTHDNGTDGIIANGSNVTFTITVTNQGTVDATAITVTDYIPTGFTLNDPAWTDNADGTASIAAGPIAAGASSPITITLTANGVADGDYVNWAEISSDDGTDVDSTPNADQTDDNQPAGPGDPTDDVIDNSTGPGGDDEDDHDPAGITVATYDLALAKVYTSDSTGGATDGIVEPGGDVTFTITVTNQGTVDATTFDVTDYLPAGFSLNDPAWTDNGDGTATITAGPLAAGDDLPITITLTADSLVAGDYVNWAEISADDGDDGDSTPNADQTDDNQPAGPGDPTDDDIDNSTGPGGDDEDDHDPAGITIATYDLALTKVYTSDDFGDTTDGIIENGADVTFTIIVTNQGTIDATTFDVTDYLPSGFVLNDPAWTNNADGTATITGGPLAAGASTPITITLTADSASGGAAVNWAEISSDDGSDIDSTTNTIVGDDNQPAAPGDPTDDVIDNTTGPGGADEDDHDPAQVLVQSFDLALIKVYTSDSTGGATDGVVEPGGDVTFTITVTNQGTVDATTFDVTDYLPTGFTLNDPAWTDNADGTATITSGPLAAGASTPITITMTAGLAPLGDFVNWAEISADDGNDADSTPNAVQGDDNQPAAPGDPTDDVIDNSTGPGGADEDDHDPAGITVAAYDLALTKVYTSDDFGDTTDGIIEVGSDVTFTITITNQGTVDATTFEVTDYIPTGFTLNDPAWTDNGDGTATITGGPLAAGASTPITITLTATSAASGDHVNWAEISADDGNDGDSTPNANQGDDNQPTAPGDPTDDVIDNSTGPGGADEDDHDPALVTIQNFDLALTKAYTSDTFANTTDGVVEPGSDVTFTITVTNQGTVDATTFDVTDYIPTGFSLNDPAWTDHADGTATITGGPLAAGASTPITITLTATATATPGTSVNWAEISADDGNDADSTPNATQGDDNQPAAPGDPTDDVIDNSTGPGGADEDDHDPAAVEVANYDLALTKVYTSDSSGDTTDGIVQEGDNITFTITVTNQGTIDATNFEVTDYIPTGFSLNDPAWTDNGDGTATITGGPLAAGASTPITITLTVDGSGDGDFVNWAEISLDDGNDIDSTPNATQGDDNQPAAPGDPTDDVIDNSTGPGGADEDDHDPAGFTVASYDLALTKTYTSDTSVDGNSTDGVVRQGDDVTFTITVTNQGSIDATTFDVTDYLPSGFTLNDPAWTDNGDGTATITGGPLAAGASVPITITMTATSSGAGDLVNLAEISLDDGDDEDSTPDADPADDNQPDAPGDPTDDVIDNSTGPGGDDEDDHDIAGITVDAFDLALVKQYTSDTSADGNTTDGAIEVGDDVTFTITVTNQGTVDATTFDVTDYIPTGFSLNDLAWTDNGDGTATITAGPLAAGDDLPITITLTADSPAQGSAVNWAEISADDNGDADSTPDADQTNDPQPDGPGDPTDDDIANTPGPGGADEDDHDVAGILVGGSFDLALRKTVAAGAQQPVVPGQDVTFEITIFNQGSTLADSISVIDYIDTTMWDSFDLADNPAGLTGGDRSMPYAWAPSGSNAIVTVGGTLAAGESITIPITLTARSQAATDPLLNVAEIATATPVNPDGSPIPATDTDSTSDTTNSETPIDDVIDGSAGDEDDHDIAEVEPAIFDLALRKRLLDGTNSAQVRPGDNVTFELTVFNQGTTHAERITLVDYMPDGLVLNDADWALNAAGDPAIALTGVVLAPGESVTVPITFRVAPGASSTLINQAEISAAVATNGNGVGLVGANGLPIPDIDSLPDANDTETPVDDVIDNTSNDEDDHDVAVLVLAQATTTTTTTIAFTGASSTVIASIGLLLLMAGGLVLSLGRRRVTEDR